METYVLQQVVLWGTGSAAGGVGSPVAGKTGTTEHSSDAWFIGYTPNLTTAVWMGYASSSRPMVNFRGTDERAGRDHPGPAVAQLHGRRPGVGSAVRGAFPLVYYLRRPDPDAARRGHRSVPAGLGTDDHHRPPTTSTTSPPSTTVPSSHHHRHAHDRHHPPPTSPPTTDARRRRAPPPRRPPDQRWPWPRRQPQPVRPAEPAPAVPGPEPAAGRAGGAARLGRRTRVARRARGTD